MEIREGMNPREVVISDIYFVIMQDDPELAQIIKVTELGFAYLLCESSERKFQDFADVPGLIIPYKYCVPDYKGPVSFYVGSQFRDSKKGREFVSGLEEAIKKDRLFEFYCSKLPLVEDELPPDIESR